MNNLQLQGIALLVQLGLLGYMLWMMNTTKRKHEAFREWTNTYITLNRRFITALSKQEMEEADRLIEDLNKHFKTMD